MMRLSVRSEVSIQLVSPASGELLLQQRQPYLKISVSIQLVSPASGEMSYSFVFDAFLYGFHSIGFPSEWGVVLLLQIDYHEDSNVSIQLVSPASGECSSRSPSGSELSVFPFNWFPQRVGSK